MGKTRKSCKFVKEEMGKTRKPCKFVKEEMGKTRKPRKFVKEEDKTENYLIMRKRNTEYARRSRMKKKIIEMEKNITLNLLKLDNEELKKSNEELKLELEKISLENEKLQTELSRFDNILLFDQ